MVLLAVVALQFASTAAGATPLENLGSYVKELENEVFPLLPATADSIRDDVIADCLAASGDITTIEGVPVRLRAIRLALRSANVFYHRHGLTIHSQAILATVRGVLAGILGPEARAAESTVQAQEADVGALPATPPHQNAPALY